MAGYTFNTPAGQTISREMLIAYLNTGTNSSPIWSPIGKRVEDSSADYDWNKETSQDILGNTFTVFKKPIITQSFDPLPLDAGDAAVLSIWQTAIVEQDIHKLANMDMLIVHKYAGNSSNAAFAERYESCAIETSNLGGEGGGNLDMPIEITYGGTRTVGTATISGGTVTFSGGASAAYLNEE